MSMEAVAKMFRQRMATKSSYCLSIGNTEGLRNQARDILQQAWVFQCEGADYIAGAGL